MGAADEGTNGRLLAWARYPAASMSGALAPLSCLLCPSADETRYLGAHVWIAPVVCGVSALALGLLAVRGPRRKLGMRSAKPPRGALLFAFVAGAFGLAVCFEMLLMTAEWGGGSSHLGNNSDEEGSAPLDGGPMVPHTR